MTGSRLGSADVVVVGAGIVGLGVALHAVERGLSVAVVERHGHATGASVRNFGHLCVTAQAGIARDYALAAREVWLRLDAEGALDVRGSGSIVVARSDDEASVLTELAGLRGPGVDLLTEQEVRRWLPDTEGIVAGAFMPDDLRVDPRSSVARIADWLVALGVEFHWGTAVQRIDSGVVTTNRGSVEAGLVVLAVGHDVEQFYPDVAREAGVRKCVLAMLAVESPLPHELTPAVMTGYSQLRYPAFADCPSIGRVRARLTSDDRAAVDAGVNLMLTQLPNGDLVLGDTHSYGDVVEPFDDEHLYALLLRAGASLLGVDELRVRQRWHGVYASAPQPYLLAQPEPGVTVASVTTGIGMTTAFGFTAHVMAESLAATGAAARQ